MKFNYNNISKFAYQLVSNGKPDINHIDDYIYNQSKVIVDKEFTPYLNKFIVNNNHHNKSQYDGKVLEDIPRLQEKLTTDLSYKIYMCFYSLYDNFIENISQEDCESKFSLHLQRTLERTPLTSEDYCFVCGVRSKLFLGDGIISNKAISEDAMKFFGKHYVSNPCLYSQGVTSFETRMNIPSGKIVFANTLYDLFKDNDESDKYINERSGYDNSINSELGVLYNQEYWSTKGLLYIQVGNTSPGIYLDSKTNSIAAIENYALEEESDKSNYLFPINVEDYEYINYICTDLWAIHAVDMTTFENYCSLKDISVEDGLSQFGAFIVDVESGEYSVTSFSAHKYSNRPVFFTMKKID